MLAAPLCRSSGLLSLSLILAALPAVDCHKVASIGEGDQVDEVQPVQSGFSKESIVETKPNTSRLERKGESTRGTMPSWIAPYFEMKLNATETFLLSLQPAVAHHANLMLGIDKYETATGLCLLCLIALILCIWVLGMSKATDPSIRAFKCAEHEKIEKPELYLTSSLSELISMLGIPAFCVLQFRNDGGATGMPIRVTVLLLAAQGWVLQGASLYLLLEGIKTAVPADPMPRPAIALATYLNVLNHLDELPLTLLLMRHVHEFHETIHDKVLAIVVNFVNGVLVPCAAIVIGGFFLSTATNYCDLFMKSVVFKFISCIDNWVVAINSRTHVIAGSTEPLMVHLPRDKEIARFLNYILCVIPVIPGLIVFVISTVSVTLRGGN